MKTPAKQAATIILHFGHGSTRSWRQRQEVRTLLMNLESEASCANECLETNPRKDIDAPLTYATEHIERILTIAERLNAIK